MRTGKTLNTRAAGFTLTELMVGLTVSSLVAIATVSAFSQQSGVIAQQTLLAQSQTDGRQAHEVISRLLRQAHRLSVNFGDALDKDGLSIGKEITFTIPAGIAIWPNSESPFNKNAVRILWHEAKKAIYIGNDTPGTAIALADMTVLSGSTKNTNTRITYLDLGEGVTRRLLTLTAQAGTTADTTTTFSVNILPRN